MLGRGSKMLRLRSALWRPELTLIPTLVGRDMMGSVGSVKEWESGVERGSKEGGRAVWKGR